MHDLAYFRANFDQIAERLATRGTALNLDQFRERILQPAGDRQHVHLGERLEVGFRRGAKCEG